MSNAKPDLTKCCCKDDRLEGFISPFRWCVALEYGFGNHLGQDHVPVTGLVRCGKCNSCWAFTMLDQKSGVVTYSLRGAQPNAMDRLVAAHSAVRKPKWPIWVPPGEAPRPHSSNIKEVEDSIWERLDDATMAVAVKNLVTGRILGSMRLGRGPTPTGDWFTNQEVRP